MNSALQKRLRLVLLVMFLFVFTILIFAPYEIFLSNQSDFSFSFYDFWWAVLIFAIVIMAIGTGLFMILPKKIYNAAITAFFSLTVLSYIQGNFLNGNLETLNGEKPEWTSHIGMILINILIWAVIIAGMYFLLLKKKKVFSMVIRIGSIFIILVQVVALAYLLLTVKIKPAQNEKLLTKGMTELSSNQNVLVFILDYFDNVYMDELLEAKPDALDKMEGFTRYTNVSSVYGRTFPSVTYLLTQEDYRYDREASEYMDQAYHNGKGIAKLRENGYGIGIYTPYEVADDMSGVADNYGADTQSVDQKGILKGLFYVTAYRDLPMALKSFFWVYTDDINLLARSDQTEAVTEDDSVFYQKLMNDGLKAEEDENVFRFYHFYGSHPPFKYDENMEATDDATRTSQCVGELSLLYTYFDQMKELGIYDSSTIIITADHGRVCRKQELEYAATPILFVKEAGEGSGSLLKISKAPVSHQDIWPTIEAAAGVKAEGKKIDDISESEIRKRYFYFASCTEDREDLLEEYELPEDANDFSKWKKTGNTWDILYSAYPVKK